MRIPRRTFVTRPATILTPDPKPPTPGPRIIRALKNIALEEFTLRKTLLAVLFLSMATFIACSSEEEIPEAQAFRFVVYPGARYLGELTEATKRAHKVINPGQEPPPTAIYDSDAPLDTVIAFYAKEYGYTEMPANSADTPAGTYHWRDGDLQTDVKSIEELLKQMNMPTDVTKAVGKYRATYLPPKPGLPRVTIQRPYFDSITSQVVDRTLVLMTR